MSRRKKEDKLGSVITCKTLEVSSKECNGDVSKMIKRFCKKTRKEEILKPFYGRLMYWETKSQKRRRKKLKSIHESNRRRKKEEENELNLEKI